MKKIITISLIMMLSGVTAWVGPARSETKSDFLRLKAAAEQGHGHAAKRMKVIPKGVILEKIRKDGQVAFESDAIQFGYGSAVVDESATAQLAEIIAALTESEDFKNAPHFYVDGHTCNIGTDENNCRLSYQRARNVVDAIVKAGNFPESKLRARGFGKNVPAFSNDTEEERKHNRRVVLRGPTAPGAEDESKMCSDSGVIANMENASRPTVRPLTPNGETEVFPLNTVRGTVLGTNKGAKGYRQPKIKPVVGQKSTGTPPPAGSFADRNQDPDMPPGFVKSNSGR